MSERNSLLIVGVYTLLGLLIVSVGYGAYAYYQLASTSAAARLEASLAAEMAEAKRPASTKPPKPMGNVAALARAHAQLNELQAMMERNSRLLEQRTSLLNQKTAECKMLQRQLDGSIATVLELLDMDSNVSDSEQRQQLGRNLEQEFNRLTAELEQSEALELEQSQQVADLKMQLTATELEIAAIREQTGAELLSLLERQQLLETTSRRAFVQLGAAAVPVLVEMLNDQRPEVRAWAASILGSLGSAGQEAVPALMAMLVDSDQLVRDEAKRSLDLLSN